MTQSHSTSLSRSHARAYIIGYPLRRFKRLACVFSLITCIGCEQIPHTLVHTHAAGAHGPYFTRNILLLRDESGREGIGEVPGGEAIKQVCSAFLVSRTVFMMLSEGRVLV